RSAMMARQLLAFSRKQLLQPVVLNLNTVVTGMEKMLRPLIGENIELSLFLDHGLKPVKADRAQLEQVLLNLAVNARDAMARGGKLIMETENRELDVRCLEEDFEGEPGSYAILSVSDTGCGMDEATRGHLFEPFFTTKPENQGIGLGLATVYGIIKQSGG